MVQETPQKIAVIFINQRTDEDDDGYANAAAEMSKLAARQKGFIDQVSIRDKSGKGITISYWESEEAILNWKENMDHLAAREKGKSRWYENYILQICTVDREYDWQK